MYIKMIVSSYSTSEIDISQYGIIWLIKFRFTCLLRNSRNNAYSYQKIYVSMGIVQKKRLEIFVKAWIRK